MGSPLCVLLIQADEPVSSPYAVALIPDPSPARRREKTPSLNPSLLAGEGFRVRIVLKLPGSEPHAERGRRQVFKSLCLRERDLG